MPPRDHIADSVIALDATYSVGSSLTGVGKYSLELMEGLRALSPATRWRSYYRPHRFLRAPWPKRLLLESSPRGASLFHGLNQRLPQRKRTLSVTTFHDLFVLTGEYSTPDFRARFAEQARHAAEHSDRIIAVSAFTAHQVSSLLGYPADRIHVVPHGVHAPATVAPLESRSPAILTVGAVQKRKNTQRLIEAFTQLPAPWELWIAGSLGFEADSMLAQATNHPRIRLLGYVSDAELALRYQQASIFAFPSLDEGFGIPVLEAMAHGLPVLTSNQSALPEVAGDAALLADPNDTHSIAAGLHQLLDPATRHTYTQLGLNRSSEFPWSRAAALTLDVYRTLLN